MSKQPLRSIVNRLLLKRRLRLRRNAYQLRYELLEARRLLAVASLPTQPFTVAKGTLEIDAGLIDRDASTDLVSLSQGGQLTVALNNNNNAWRSVSTYDLGLGTTYGMTSGLLDRDAALDLVVIGESSA